jgi:hypothetical protein
MRKCVVVVSLVTMLSACSFMQIRPTPEPTKTAPASCASLGWVGLDLLGGLASALVATLSTIKVEGRDPAEPEPGKGSTYTFAVVSGVYGASMIYGVVATSVCNSRAEEMRKTQAR